ncbi:MAG: 5'/3'-nucleotidase SurE, partial [Ilumatobacteraceae bacterium]
RIVGIDEAWAVNGPPALCVMFARLGAFGAPFDLVVSGINPGVNVGRSVYHSGTVGACLSARNGRISGVAGSQAVDGVGVEGQGWDEMIVGQKWETAASVASAVVEGLVIDMPNAPVVVTVNVPTKSIEDLRGWKVARVGHEPPRRMSTAELEPKAGHEGAFWVRMKWGEAVELPADTDGGLVENDYVSISYLTALTNDDHVERVHGAGALDRLLAGPTGI